MVMIDSHIRFRINRSQFMLCRSYFIVLCLRRYSNLPEFYINIFHKSGNSLTNRTKIMIVQLLAFRRHCSKERASRIDQIFSLAEFFGINQEIFLFRSHRRSYFLRCCISKQTDQSQRLFIDCLHRAKKRCLLI